MARGALSRRPRSPWWAALRIPSTAGARRRALQAEPNEGVVLAAARGRDGPALGMLRAGGRGRQRAPSSASGASRADGPPRQHRRPPRLEGARALGVRAPRGDDRPAALRHRGPRLSAAAPALAELRRASRAVAGPVRGPRAASSAGSPPPGQGPHLQEPRPELALWRAAARPWRRRYWLRTSTGMPAASRRFFAWWTSCWL